MAVAAGELCTQCWTGSLELHQGMLVCDVCGSIHQGFAEEAQEYQTGISDARFFKKSEGMKRVGAAKEGPEEPPPPPPVREAVQAYVQALQALLQAQAQALVGSCGMAPALLPVLRELWLAFVAHSQLLEAATTTRLQALAEQVPTTSSGSEDGSEGHDDGAEEGEAGRAGGGRGRWGQPLTAQMTHERLSARIGHEIGPKLRPQHTLSLVLLACWQQGEAASPLDVARWALDGHLPYLAFAAEQGSGLQQFTSILGRKLVTPLGVPSPKFLQQQACQLAAQLGLGSIPPLSPALWLERYLAELELTQALLPVALQLHSLYQPAPLLPTAEYRVHRHPWALLMGSLLLAVKLCYGLDGGQRQLAGLPPAPVWQDWARRQIARLGRLSSFPLSLAEAAQLDGPAFQAYLQYLQRGLFASFSPPADLESMHQLFQRLALPEDGGRGAWAVALPAGAAGGAGLGPNAFQQAGAAGQAGNQAAAAGDARQPQASYAFYGGTAGRGGSRGGVGGEGAARQRRSFHPDYAVALAACAPLVWLQPESLHELLAGLEQSMIAAETEASFAYNSQEMRILAKQQEEAAWLAERKATAGAGK